LTHYSYNATMYLLVTIEYNLQGRVKFPTGGNAILIVSPRAKADLV